MTEAIILTICVLGNTNACETSGKAYYIQSGLERKVNKIAEKHIYLSYISGIIGMYKEQRAIIPVYRKENNAVDLDVSNIYNGISYKRGF